MATTRLARGIYALGICQRCGQRAKRSELVEDGVFQGMLVHRECRDMPHPQERPPIMRPERKPVEFAQGEQSGIAPVLVATPAGASVSLAWSKADPTASTMGRIEKYEVWRTPATTGVPELRATLLVSFGDGLTVKPIHPVSTSDSITPSAVYAYKVVAKDMNGNSLTSNTANVS